jgi:hypothetical protein
MGQLFKQTNEHNIFLERIRFALDQGIGPGEQMFYFGLPG